VNAESPADGVAAFHAAADERFGYLIERGFRVAHRTSAGKAP
jgi:hypothetical protein